MASPTQPQNRTLIVFFVCLSVYAFYATWGISVLDGTGDRILGIRWSHVPILPGTDEPLRLRYTGIAALDWWFTIMVLFFWQAVDGSHPATSLAGIYFLGQLVGAWTLMFVEGARATNKGGLIARSLLWTLLMQNLTLGCFGPLYFAIHLASLSRARQPTTTDSVLAAARYFKFLPFSIFLGFVVPSIFMGLPAPNVISYASQQAAIAVWTPFPVWVEASQLVLLWCDAALSSSRSSGAGARPTPVEAQKASLFALRGVYVFALVGSSLVHVGVVTTSLSTALFPAIFSPDARAYFAPFNMLFPRNGEVVTIGASILTFMQWDQWVGYSSLLIWALKLGLGGGNSVAAASWLRLVGYGLAFASAVAILGPAGAAVLLLWRRDEKEHSDEAARQQSVKQRT